MEAEVDVTTLSPLAARFFGRNGSNPPVEGRSDLSVDHRGASGAPIFPWKVSIPIPPHGLLAACERDFTHERQVGDGNDARPAATLFWIAIAVSECVELFDVSDVDARLLAHPPPQPQF
jgi:hypothetical protein